MLNNLIGIPLAFILSFGVATSTPLEAQKGVKVERNDIQLTVSRYAFVYGVDEDILNKVIHCESTHNPNAVNLTKREYSVGIAQLNLKAHPEISEEQARDYDFSIRYMAQKISQGKGDMWTCYKG